MEDYSEEMERGAAGVLFLCSKTGRVLLQQRSEHGDAAGTWACFGGGIEKGESPDEAARREISEETGYHADYSLVPLYCYEKAGFTYWNYLSVIDHEFYAATNYETAAAEWFALADLPVDDLHPGFRICLEDDYAQAKIKSYLKDLNEDMAEHQEAHRRDLIDPALLTFREYFQLCGGGKSHPDSAYNVNLADLNRGYDSDKPEQYQTQLRRLKVRGLWFDIKMRKEKNSYVKRGADGTSIVLGPDGNAEYFTDEESVAKGLALYEIMLAIFNEDGQRVATFQDEWGCVLIMVASEYRGFGFGPMLTKMGRTIYPSKTSGGFTQGGAQNFRKVHTMFVNEALRNGKYVRLVKAKEMSAERAKEIIASAKESGFKEYEKEATDMSSSDPSTWLLMGDEYGSFILYDRKLRDAIDDSGRYDHFMEKMIKGMIYVVPGEKYGIVHAYGGENEKIKALMLRIAAQYCAKEDVMFVVDAEDIQDVPEEYLEIVGGKHVASGFWRHTVVIRDGKGISYEGMVDAERKWRESFDRYGEFNSRVQEAAYAKYRPQ